MPSKPTRAVSAPDPTAPTRRPAAPRCSTDAGTCGAALSVLVTDRSPTAALDDLGWPWRTTRHLDVDRNHVADRTHDAAPAGEHAGEHAAVARAVTDCEHHPRPGNRSEGVAQWL